MKHCQCQKKLAGKKRTKSETRKYSTVQSFKEDMSTFIDFVHNRHQFKLTTQFFIELRNLQSANQKCEVNTDFHIELTFPEIKSVPFNSLPRPRIHVLHISQAISSSENTRKLIDITLERDNFFG